MASHTLNVCHFMYKYNMYHNTVRGCIKEILNVHVRTSLMAL